MREIIREETLREMIKEGLVKADDAKNKTFIQIIYTVASLCNLY